MQICNNVFLKKLKQDTVRQYSIELEGGYAVFCIIPLVYLEYLRIKINTVVCILFGLMEVITRYNSNQNS